MKESQHISTEDITDILHSRDASAKWLYWPMCNMETSVDNWRVVFLCRVQITFSCNWYQDEIVTNTDFLTLASLFAGGMNGPPTGFALCCLLETDIEWKFVLTWARRQTCEVLGIGVEISRLRLVELAEDLTISLFWCRKRIALPYSSVLWPDPVPFPYSTNCKWFINVYHVMMKIMD